MFRTTATSLALVSVCITLVVSGCGGRATGPAEDGVVAAARGDWFGAYAAYDRAVERSPHDLAIRRERIRAAQNSGVLPELEQRLESQLERQSGDGEGAPSRYELALAIATLGEPRSDQRALELLAQVSEQLSDEPDVYYRAGLLRLEQERFVEAVEPLSRAVELAPRSARFRVALAAALAETSEGGDRAREVLAEIPELEPRESDLERGRAILSRLNNPIRRVPVALRESYREAIAALSEEGSAIGEAVQLIEEALEVAPSCGPFIVLNGLASVRLGQLGRARASFLRATELWPSDPVPWIELALLSEETERLAEAERFLGRALEVDPLSRVAWGELGRIRYQRRRFELAADAFHRLLVIDGGQMLSQLWLGRALRRAGRDEEAERVYLEIAERHPGNYEACLQLGHIYRRRRLRAEERGASEDLLEQARHWYRQALEVRPQDPMIERLIRELEERREPEK